MSMQTETAGVRYPSEDASSTKTHATPVLSRVVPMPPIDAPVDQAPPDGATVVEREQAIEAPPRESRFPPFPFEEFASKLDPAVVKARYQVGPIDPTIVFIGDLDHRHGPDLLVRAMPPILKNHAQARLVVVGDGPLLWPLRVMSRYMLLDHAVRIIGHVGGGEVRELVAAADIIAVPSREQTEDWQILAGWSARRPVVATHEVAGSLCRHEHDGVLIYANPASCVWGVERVLCDPELGRRVGDRGYQNLAGGSTEKK